MPKKIPVETTVSEKKTKLEKNKKSTRPPLVQFRRFCLNNIENKDDSGNNKKVLITEKFLKLTRKKFIDNIKKQAKDSLYICQKNDGKRKTVLPRDNSEKRDLKKNFL